MIVSRRTWLRAAARYGAALAAGPALGEVLPSGPVCTTRKDFRPVVLQAPEAPKVPMLHPDRLARWVDPLPLPPRAQASGTRPDPANPKVQLPYYRLAMQPVRQSVHRDVPPTVFWGYGGSVPGPTLEVHQDQPVLVEWVNDLPREHCLPLDYTLHGAGRDVPDVRAVVHVHGARVPPQADGYPEHWYPPGKSVTYRYPNGQESATLWYHDHAMGIERLNVYAGLFGTYLVRDDVEAGLSLPSGEFELPLLITDRQFTQDGALYYPTSGMDESPWVSEVYGDVILVNGKFAPFHEVAPARYRLRIVNASNARFYYLALSDGSPLTQIGSDQGLLERPLPQKSLTLAPAERADVLVDFSPLAGKTITLKSQAFELMQFRVRAAPAQTPTPLPALLRPLPRMAKSQAVKTRRLTLNNYEDPQTHMMLMLLNGTYWHQPVTEKPRLGSTEIWEFVNLTEDVHPIHLHLVRFQVLDRQRFDVDEYLQTGKMVLMSERLPPLENERGWKDTVQAHNGLITRIIVRFDGYPGRYVWHCHVLEHSANEMMRPYEVMAPHGGQV